MSITKYNAEWVAVRAVTSNEVPKMLSLTNDILEKDEEMMVRTTTTM